MIEPVSPERLAALSPEQPTAYRDYAEELAEKRIDPDAQAAAIRLYLIAAWLDPERLAKSSLLGMTALARSPEEERKFRAMAYLHDPDHDRRLLRTEAAPRAAPSPPPETRDALLRALKLRRQGNRRAALLNLARPGVQDELLNHRDVLTFEEFSQPGLSDALLRKIVALELALEAHGVSEPSADASRGGASWGAIITRGDTAPIPSLRWETLTEFDPRLCMFRDGKWIASQP